MTVVTKSPLIGSDTSKIIPASSVEENQTTGGANPPAAPLLPIQVTDDAGSSGQQQAATPPPVDLDGSTTEASSCNQSTDTSIDNAATPTHEADFSGGESSGVGNDDFEPTFPHAELARLDEMINRPRWVVPVLHNGELEILLDASIELCRRGEEFVGSRRTWSSYCNSMFLVAYLKFKHLQWNCLHEFVERNIVLVSSGVCVPECGSIDNNC